jgi:uncharacterized membrane protein YgdD (TMEM256/DUF423 family)
MRITFITLGAALGLLAVVAGTFGAHGLKGHVEPDLLAIYHTGAQYHMYHALALLLTGLVYERHPSRPVAAAGWCFVVGVVIFSGSLYALAISGQRWLGAITPIGGVSFLVGWAMLMVCTAMKRQE